MKMKSIILFDGDCSFCHRSVQFIIKRDPKREFQFAAIESEIGKQIIEKYHISKSLNSIILVENNQYYIKSTAVLRICRKLKGIWKGHYVFIVIPAFIRHFIYDFIAKHRYRIGKATTCTIPKKEDLDRFLS